MFFHHQSNSQFQGITIWAMSVRFYCISNCPAHCGELTEIKGPLCVQVQLDIKSEVAGHFEGQLIDGPLLLLFSLAVESGLCDSLHWYVEG